MSEHSITIVPRKSVYPDNENKAKEILEWLVSRDIVKAELSDCVVSAGMGYAISKGAKHVTVDSINLPYNYLTSNGLEVITERQVFHTGENGMEHLICPKCKQDISSEDWDYLSDWADNKTNDLTCPRCNIATDIHHFEFTPQWGFSNLGFTFWNWPELSIDFINEFKLRLGCDVDIVYTWL